MAADPRLPSRTGHPLGIVLMVLMAKIGGLAKRTSHWVAAAALEDGYANDQDVDSLVAELHALRCKVIAWRRDFNTALIHAADGTRSNAMDNKVDCVNKRYELLGVSLVVHVLANRMLVSLSPPMTVEACCSRTTPRRWRPSLSRSTVPSRRTTATTAPTSFSNRKLRSPMRLSQRTPTSGARQCEAEGRFVDRVGTQGDSARHWEGDAAMEEIVAHRDRHNHMNCLSMFIECGSNEMSNNSNNIL